MKVVLQDGIKDCGVCCLLSIIRFYGGDVSKEYLREITHTTKEGVSLYNLIEGAKIIGFEAIGLTGDLDNIKEENLNILVENLVSEGTNLLTHFCWTMEFGANGENPIIDGQTYEVVTAGDLYDLLVRIEQERMAETIRELKEALADYDVIKQSGCYMD